MLICLLRCLLAAAQQETQFMRLLQLLAHSPYCANCHYAGDGRNFKFRLKLQCIEVLLSTSHSTCH